MIPSSRCWGRDGCVAGCDFKTCKKNHTDGKCRLNPFERGMRNACYDLQNPPPIESLLLLAVRSGIDEDLITSITTKRRSLTCEIPKIFPDKDMTEESEIFPIPWVNETGDNEQLKANFTYVRCAIESQNVVIPWLHFNSTQAMSTEVANLTQDPNQIPKLKSWETSESTQTSSRKKQRQICDENIQGLTLKKQLPEHLQNYFTLQCNYLCPCAKKKRAITIGFNRKLAIVNCGNRHITDGIKHKIEIFRTQHCGWGVRTSKHQTIQKGEIVCTYGGVYVSEKDAKEKNFYIKMPFALNKIGEYLVIDSTKYRSVGGFINHACKSHANLKECFLLGDHLSIRHPSVAFRATTLIEPNTELCFNYGYKVEDTCKVCSQKHCLCQDCMPDICTSSNCSHGQLV